MSPLFATWTPSCKSRVDFFLTIVYGFQRQDAGGQLVDSGATSSDRSGAGTVPPGADSCEEGNSACRVVDRSGAGTVPPGADSCEEDDSACRVVVVVDECQSLVSARCLLVVVPPHTPHKHPQTPHPQTPHRHTPSDPSPSHTLRPPPPQTPHPHTPSHVS